MHKYEVEIVNFETSEQDGARYWAESEIAMLTGLELEEILQVTAGVSRYYGSWWPETFRKLGFNCNPRWIKFDKDTRYPCMMRCHIKDDKSHWAGFVYYDGVVYHLDYGKIPLEQFYELWGDVYKPTSMLQVWI